MPTRREAPRRRPLWREPLLHFLVVGAALYALDLTAGAAPEASGTAPIVVTEDFVRSVRAELRRDGGAVDEAAVQAAVDRYVEEEALVREARRLGLDRGDLVVRRRLVQKMEFLMGDLAVAAEPTEAELRTWLEEHAAEYALPARATFRHVYFSRDRHGENTTSAARAALDAGLSDTPPDDAGDPFLLGSRFEGLTEAETARRFGPAFAAAVFSLPEGEWRGPIASAYGAHVVRVETRTPARSARLEDVRARVRADVRAARRAAAEREARRALRDRYDVRMEAPVAGKSDG